MITKLWYKLKYIVIGVTREALKKPQRSTQEILNIIILTGIYNEKDRNFMCGALFDAKYYGFISRDEKSKVACEIRQHLRGYAFLKDALEANYLPYSFKDTKNIYLNWDNRPTILTRSQLASVKYN